MIKCPNKKCESEMPDSYRYCIYCSAKLPKTEANSKKREKNPPPMFNICLGIIGIVLTLALVAAVILFF